MIIYVKLFQSMFANTNTNCRLNNYSEILAGESKKMLSFSFCKELR